MTLPILYVGMDVHKDFVVIAVFRGRSQTPLLLEKVPFDPHRLRRFFERLARQGQLRCCYEASDAGYVLQRWMTTWGYACELVAPSLIPTKPGDRRKHDKRDAVQLARLFRAGELTLIHVPTEAEKRVRDLVRCRETFQREITKSRHYILKFLRRRGFIFRGGQHWTARQFEWLRQVHATPGLASTLPISKFASSAETAAFGGRNRWLNITIVLAEEYVGFEEIDDGLWTLYYSNIEVGRLDERTFKIIEPDGRANRTKPHHAKS